MGWAACCGKESDSAELRGFFREISRAVDQAGYICRAVVPTAQQANGVFTLPWFPAVARKLARLALLTVFSQTSRTLSPPWFLNSLMISCARLPPDCTDGRHPVRNFVNFEWLESLGNTVHG